MSYVVFARKYRPQTFDEVVGQGHVAQTLRNAISGDRLAHAYLFCGPRGVGKTTMARLLAKAVNCLVSPGAAPCGTCEACTSIAAGHDVDVLELDAASRRKVEDVEPLIDSSRYLPQRSPRKVFIVDEAHMLSKTAWNALLKTLEEPPPHVLFIFATTEPQKVIETVRSRCQRFDFRRITETDIVAKLRRIADAEGANVEDGVLSEIASRATGGLRDAETLLDQALSAAPADRALRPDDLVAILGGTPRALRASLIAAAQAGDMPGALAGAAELVDAGADPVELLHDLFADVHRFAVDLARGRALDGSLSALTVEWCLAAADLFSRHKQLARESRAARASLDLGLLAVSRLGDVRISRSSSRGSSRWGGRRPRPRRRRWRRKLLPQRLRRRGRNRRGCSCPRLPKERLNPRSCAGPNRRRRPRRLPNRRFLPELRVPPRMRRRIASPRRRWRRSSRTPACVRCSTPSGGASRT